MQGTSCLLQPVSGFPHHRPQTEGLAILILVK